MPSDESPGPEIPGKLQRIAFHEAGHTVAAIVLEYLIKDVKIDPESLGGGKPSERSSHCISWADGIAPMDLQRARNRALFAFAGDAAEMFLLGGRPLGERFTHFKDYRDAFVAVAEVIPEN